MSLRAQTLATEYQKLQIDLQNAVDARQRLGAQLAENEMVKKEFDQLTPNNTVYKLIGPVLVQQDQADAKNNVDTRLEFIKGEIKRLEAQLKDITAKSEKKKNELVEIQSQLQQQSQKESSAPSVPASITA